MQSRRYTSLLCGAVLTLSLLLSGCMVGPNFKAPATPDMAKPPRSAEPAGDAEVEIAPETLAAWWTVLDDPLLTELIQQALTENKSFQATRAQVRQARAQVGIAFAGLLPQLNAAGLYRRSGTSENLGMGPRVTQDFYQGALDAAWEIDIFGGVRRGVQAARADLEATEANLQDAWVTLAAEVAQTYIALRTTQQQLAVTEKNLKTQTDTLELLLSRREAGLADELAVLQARYNAERTRSAIPTLRSAIETTLHALAVLTGRTPADLDERLRTEQAIPTPAKRVAVGVPADALRRRPDIRRAERQLAAQTARVGVATADLYPRFSLLGSIGLESISSSDFFRSGSRAWGWGPTVSWPIFRGGSIRQNIKAQTAGAEQALALYEQNVLAAVKEVQDALVDYAEQQNRRDALMTAVHAAGEAVEVSQDQYKHGLVDFSNVLDAQRSLLTLEAELVASSGAISTNLVRLYKALGGGWEALDAKAAQAQSEDQPKTDGESDSDAPPASDNAAPAGSAKELA